MSETTISRYYPFKGINNWMLKIQKADDIIGRQGAGRKSIADRKAVLQIPFQF
jgi:hypothetical protein